MMTDLFRFWLQKKLRKQTDRVTVKKTKEFGSQK